MKRLALITTSDWHLRTTVPASRAEKDWYEVMGRRMHAIAQFGVPILVAGDLFDRHDPPASLVSWALRYLPEEIYAIPGQHDIRGHCIGEVETGAFGALVRAEAIRYLDPDKTWKVNGINIYPMPWGMYDLPKERPEKPSVAVVHKYVWATADDCHAQAEDASRVTSISEWANWFDHIVIGDNHIAWRAGKFLNHGSLFSMSSAQKEHVPYIGKIYSDGSMEVVQFPEEDIEWKENCEILTKANTKELLHALAELQSDSISFTEALARLEERSNGQAREIVRNLRKTICDGN